MSSENTKSPAPAALPIVKSILDIDPDGDLVVSVGGEKNANLMRVSSEVLTLVSPVLKIMLGKDWLQGQKVHLEQSPLRLPEDDPTAMELVFKLCHYKFLSCASIPEEQLLPMVCSLEKYSALAPFRLQVLDKAGNWQRKNVAVQHTPESRRPCLRGLVMAYMFNDTAVFQILSQKLLLLTFSRPIGESQAKIQERVRDLGTHTVVRDLVGK
jgi:hypothetical protein